MLARRIIPCLDIKDGKVVKGVNFVGIKEVGEVVECAEAYSRQGADELVFLDITATSDARETVTDLVRRAAKRVFVPLTVGGGIRTTEDFRSILRAGADKVAVNSAAVKNPDLISDAAKEFGSQCVVLAVDVKRTPEGVHVFTAGGRIDTGLDATQWILEGARRGAGEILLTSMDTDGTRGGFDVEYLARITSLVNLPVIASGGCGSLEHFYDVFDRTGATGALAASLFHYGELTVGEVKEYLASRGIPVRR